MRHVQLNLCYEQHMENELSKNSYLILYSEGYYFIPARAYMNIYCFFFIKVYTNVDNKNDQLEKAEKK